MEDKTTNCSYTVVQCAGDSLPEQYKAMVYSKWMRKLRYGNEYFKLIEAKAYYEAYSKYIAHILSKMNCLVRIAVLSDDKDVALGFSVSENNILHFVITFKDYRKLGIAKSLVPFEVKTITHLTKMGMQLWQTKLPKAVFNPFYI